MKVFAVTSDYLEEEVKVISLFLLIDGYRISFFQSRFLTEYDILIGSPLLFRWVAVRGKFILSKLRGSQPIECV